MATPNQVDFTAIIIALLSASTVLIAWIFRYRIASLGKIKAKKDDKEPSTVLFEGYEKLLKQYQDELLLKDNKINKLESALDHVRTELDNAQVLIAEMRADTLEKTHKINTLETKLAELREITAS